MSAGLQMVRYPHDNHRTTLKGTVRELNAYGSARGYLLSVSLKQTSRKQPMTTRNSCRTVSFHQPFLRRGFESEQPAGAYVVDTEEELIESITFPAWRRVATTIQLRRNGTTEHLRIDPVELDDAWARDAWLSVNVQQESQS